MLRVLHLTMMKAWLCMSEALKCSKEDLNSLQAYAKLNEDIEGRLVTTTWHTHHQNARKEVKAMHEKHRRNDNQIAVSKAL